MSVGRSYCDSPSSYLPPIYFIYLINNELRPLDVDALDVAHT